MLQESEKLVSSQATQIENLQAELSTSAVSISLGYKAVLFLPKIAKCGFKVGV